MTLKKDKQKVLGEVFSDDRVKEFLSVKNVGDTDPDYTALERAYRGMNIENFESFVKYFVEDAKNINCKNAQGNTFLEVISKHRHSGPYVSVLKDNGAK